MGPGCTAACSVCVDYHIFFTSTKTLVFEIDDPLPFHPILEILHCPGCPAACSVLVFEIDDPLPFHPIFHCPGCPAARSVCVAL